jgi:signal transduction histidine kinase
MSPFQRYRWYAVAGATILALAVVSATVPRGRALTGIFDVGYFLVTLSAGAAMLANAVSERGPNRRFWALMGVGCLLWTVNQGAWIYYEVLYHTTFPDPSFVDLFLFLHLIPMIAAIGLRPHRSEGELKFHVGALDFFLLLVWWLFLYAFVVFPSQYVSLSVAQYDRSFGPLYSVESGMLVLVMGIAARGAPAAWKKVYLNLMAASALYALGSEAEDLALSHAAYYTGSLYDVVLLGAVCWMAATALSARTWQLKPAVPRSDDKWGAMALRLAMLAMLSLPALGLWTFAWDAASSRTRAFRLFTVLAAMLVLGMFLFVRQYLLDQALMSLLEGSRRSFENEQRLQSHLVQREKLASLGKLVAGAAQEIDQPLMAIMGYSEKLWSNQRLSSEQDALVRKIVSHSQRTRELVASLQSFAQQNSAEKAMVDLSVLLQRSVQMHEMRRNHAIRIEIVIEPELPRVWGDGHQLFQTFVQIVENSVDALAEAGGGLLQVSAHLHGDEVLLQFDDSGPGIKEPNRVFDPFYTTKPVGKGTGLGLSAVYGVVQDHHGQITCHNKAEGGAVFVLRLPTATRAAGETASSSALATASS